MSRFLSFRKIFLYMCCLSLNGINQATAQLNFTYHKESKVMYSVSNDAQSIIVSLKVGDPMQQMKLMRNGLEIWVDYKGKTTKKTGIKYPLPSSGNFQQQGMQPPRNNNNNADEAPSIRPMLELLMTTKREIELVGFKEEINGKFDVTGFKTMLVEIGFGEKDTILYQCSIPFSAFEQALDFSKTFSVGIVVKGMERPDMGGGGMPGGPPGAGMMPPGGGMGGGRMGGMGGGMPDMREMEKMFSDNIIWQKIQFKL